MKPVLLLFAFEEIIHDKDFFEKNISYDLTHQAHLFTPAVDPGVPGCLDIREKRIVGTALLKTRMSPYKLYNIDYIIWPFSA